MVAGIENNFQNGAVAPGDIIDVEAPPQHDGLVPRANGINQNMRECFSGLYRGALGQIRTTIQEPINDLIQTARRLLTPSQFQGIMGSINYVTSIAAIIMMPEVSSGLKAVCITGVTANMAKDFSALCNNNR